MVTIWRKNKTGKKCDSTTESRIKNRMSTESAWEKCEYKKKAENHTSGIMHTQSLDCNLHNNMPDKCMQCIMLSCESFWILSAYWASHTCLLSITLFCPVAVSQQTCHNWLGLVLPFRLPMCVSIVLQLLVHQRSLLSSNISGLHRGSIFFFHTKTYIAYNMNRQFSRMQAESATQKQHHLLTAPKKKANRTNCWTWTLLRVNDKLLRPAQLRFRFVGFGYISPSLHSFE